MDRVIINIIPNDYKGNPREALGYAWSKYVRLDESWTAEQKQADPWGGCAPDREKSVPGDDRIGGYDEYLAAKADVEKTCPGVLWAPDWLDVPRGAESVAFIQCMWCGGAKTYGYRANNDTGSGIKAVVNAGEEPHETAAIVALQERLAEDEIDERNSRHPGWCSKCHSYCYGDCES